MNGRDISEWMISGIENVVYVGANTDTGWVDVDGVPIKHFPCRRWHGLVLRLDGMVRYVIDGRMTVDAEQGMLVYLPKGYEYRGESHESGSCYCINFLIDGESDIDAFSITPRNFQKLKADFVEMLHLWTYRKPGWQARLLARLYDLLASIEEDRHAKYLPGRQAAVLREQMAKFQQNSALPMSVPDMAAQCGMCETYFRRLFRELYGVSPKQYIQDVRFRQAKALLTGTDAGIGHIAQVCGFENIYHFSRAFRICEGVSPSEYRKQHRTSEDGP